MPLDIVYLSNTPIKLQILAHGYKPDAIKLTKGTMSILREKYPPTYELLEYLEFNRRDTIKTFIDYHLGDQIGNVVFGQNKVDDQECVLYFEKIVGHLDGDPVYYSIDISGGTTSKRLKDMFQELKPPEKETTRDKIYHLVHPKKEKEKIQLNP